MTQQEKTAETQRYYDHLPRASRMFIDEYGFELWQAWRKSRVPMREFEVALRRRWGHKPDGIAPVTDAYEKGEGRHDRRP